MPLVHAQGHRLLSTFLREYRLGCTLKSMETLTHAPVLARFGYAVSDPTRAQVLLALAEAPSYPSDLADSIGVSRQSMSNHLTCLRGCGLVVAVPDGRRTLYELADAHLGHAIKNLLGVVLAADPACCAPDGTCLV